MDLWNLAIVASVSLADLGLGALVYLRNPRSASNRAFTAVMASISAWITAAYISDQAIFWHQALFLNRLTFAAALLMGVCLLRFVVTFPAKTEQLPLAWRAYIAGSAILGAVILLTPLVLSGVSRDPRAGTDPQAGPAFPLMIAWVVVGGALILYALAKKYRSAQGRAQAQLKFMLLGVAILACGSMLFGLIIPALSGSYALSELAVVSTLGLGWCTAYAIVKHRLMDIRRVLLRSAAYSLLVLAASASLGLVWYFTQSYLSRLLPSSGTPIAFILSTLVVLALRPIQLLLDGLTDRQLYRGRRSPSELLAELGRGMSSTLDETGLAQLLARTLARELRLGFAGVAFYRAGQPELVLSDASAFHESAQSLLDLGAERAIFVADEDEPETEWEQHLEDSGARVVATLRSGEGEFLGVVILGPKESGSIYSAEDISFLEVLLPEAAIAMKNALLFSERNQRVRELSAINELALEVSSSIELKTLLEVALDKAVAVTGADSGSIMLLDEEQQTLSIAASRGIDPMIAATTRVPVGFGVAGWVAKEGRSVMLPGMWEPSLCDELLRDDVDSAICTPITSKDAIIGVLSVNRADSARSFTQENMNVVDSFARQLGIAIENARLYTNLEDTFLGTIKALAAAIDAKDPYTWGHSSEVTELSVAIAEAMGLDASDVQQIRIAATLHDIGKIGIDGAILVKPGRLTAEERTMINQHPSIAANILAPLDFLRDMVPLVLFHHERFGGGGYPTGISGQAIPLGARIISVADSFNAMVSDRPYRQALQLDVAIGELCRNAGSQFDPTVVDAFCGLVERGTLSDLLVAAPQEERAALPAAEQRSEQHTPRA
jgi:putative nucleotidyltransferase with HDIG domain